jgi:hypothetical protein
VQRFAFDQALDATGIGACWAMALTVSHWPAGAGLRSGQGTHLDLPRLQSLCAPLDDQIERGQDVGCFIAGGGRTGLARAGYFVYTTGRSSRATGASEFGRPETIEETG